MPRDFGNALVTGTLFVGLSAIIGLTGIPGQVPPTYIQTVTPGATLEIIGLGGTAIGTGFTGGPVPRLGASGFFVVSGTTMQPLCLNMVGTVWFAATGATVAVQYLQHRSQDFT